MRSRTQSVIYSRSKRSERGFKFWLAFVKQSAAFAAFDAASDLFCISRMGV
jgi:hypothetical protein